MSKIPTRDEYLKKLRNHEAYSAILKKAPDVETRKKIVAMTEQFAVAMFDSMFSVMGTLKSDPEAVSKISEALKDGTSIIKESDGAPLVSGSKG